MVRLLAVCRSAESGDLGLFGHGLEDAVGRVGAGGKSSTVGVAPKGMCG